MSIIPNSFDPSADYVTPGVTPPMTINGLVYNKIYAHTGVVDSLSTAGTLPYTDPVFGISNTQTQQVFAPMTTTYWLSDKQFGGPDSVPVTIQYNLSNATYFNNIILYVLNVPCYVELGYNDSNGNFINYPGDSSYVINGGTDINTTTSWVRIAYDAPSTQIATNNITLRITRKQNVQQIITVGQIPVNIAYSVGVRDFNIHLNINSNSDIPSAVISGTSNIVTQNRFGFVENYNYNTNSVNNIFTNNGNYWKCAPQPVGDAIVYFYVKISDPTPTNINRLYIDPLYSNCKFNIYYTTGTNDDPSNFLWTPIQRDFNLRKGLYDIPNISCTYLKFEFTKLSPEVYDLPFDSVERTINVFPYSVEDYYTNLESNIINGNAVKYANVISDQTVSNFQVNNQLAATTLFGTTNNSVGNSNTWPLLSALNNSQYGNTTTTAINGSTGITDPTTSYKLIDKNGNYNGQSYSEFLQRRFVSTQQHYYSEITINHSWHQAYFVGIRYLTAFYETTYDDLRGTPNNLLSKNNNNNFVAQDNNYVMLNVDEYALTPWFSTVDSFNSFNIGGLTTDWQSFLSDDQTLMNVPGYVVTSGTATPVSTLGSSTIVSVVPQSGTSSCSIKSAAYSSVSNLLNYYDANFIPTSGSLNWSANDSTTISGTTVNIYPPSGSSFIASGLSVSGGTYTTYYNFTLPSVGNASGTKPWAIEFAAGPLGTVGYGSYNPVTGGFSYYFLTNVQTPGTVGGSTPTATTTITAYTQFVNSSGTVIPNTTITGSQITVTNGSGSNLITVTGATYSSSVPSNQIQFVISGTPGVPYNLYQMGVFNTPTSTWVSAQDRSNMRVSGVARILLPSTNTGTYRTSLYANAIGSTTPVEIAFKQYGPGAIPINTWVDIELATYVTNNYTNFYVVFQQTNPSVNETFYISMLAPFYHPVRYEYITRSGSNTWQPITTGINNPDACIATVSGLPASGIQVRMTALDPNVFISGVSILPRYKQNPYYQVTAIDYVGNSKTNELSARRNISNKPYFMLNHEPRPQRFSINQVAGTVIPYVIG